MADGNLHLGACEDPREQGEGEEAGLWSCGHMGTATRDLGCPGAGHSAGGQESQVRT